MQMNLRLAFTCFYGQLILVREHDAEGNNRSDLNSYCDLDRSE